MKVSSNVKNAVMLFSVATLLCFNACAKKGQEQVVEEKEFIEVYAEETVVDPAEEKLDAVYEMMSSRFKGDVHISDKQQFLADLYEVLEFDKETTTDDLSLFYLIDKTHKVGRDYEPKHLMHLENNAYYSVNKNNLNLRPEAYNALEAMCKKATADGVSLTVSSTYRSYEYQDNLFNYWVSVDGLEEAERESARPGTSQHQLGLALDFAPVDDAFDLTPGGAWVYKNAYKYGFSLSFPKNYEDVTGYRWECWHFRYVGVKACEFQRKYFNDVQQYMIEFIDAWKNYN